MAKRPFHANSWLKHNKQALPELPNTQDGLSYNENSAPEEVSKKFQLSEFFIPGWKGDSLFSKPALAIKKVQEHFWADALEQFKNLGSLNKSLKLSIFNEYLAYKEFYQIKGNDLDSPATFWHHLPLKNSAHRKTLDHFLEIYCFRVATIYLYKLLFISSLANRLNLPLSEASLLNPNSFLSRCFPSGGSFELNCEALRTNQYSWYRANQKLSPQIESLLKNFKDLSISQLMKLSTYRGFKGSKHNFKFEDTEYSHALSHKSFGLFINSLLIYLPIWLEQDKLSYPMKFIAPTPSCMNTKFAGDKLISLCHSHWLAQEANLDKTWSEILCPDFSTEKYNNGMFMKICHELQFLTFLVKFTGEQNYPLKETLSKTIREKYSHNPTESSGQMALFARYENKSELSYKRIVLMLSDLPKKNPHHYLIGKINDQKTKLTKNGFVYVFTNQKLFVPSQSQKVEQLLNDFEVKSIFNFEDLHGKGEIPSYVYVLKKRKPMAMKGNPFDLDPFSLSQGNSPKQEPCLTFRLNGTLTQFHTFENMVSALTEFFENKSSSCTPLFTKALEDDLHFEYHQDAIIEGRLLSSISEDQQRVTHPNFFRKLTKNSLSLDNFFALENLENQGLVANDLLGIRSQSAFPYLLIVDYRDPAFVRLEICRGDNYKAKREEYGVAFFQYFGLMPKMANININLFREYFKTDIGKQIIQLSLSGGKTKIKSKLNSLLIPNFFADTKDYPEYEKANLDIFRYKKDDLLNQHPESLTQLLSQALETVQKYEHELPWMSLGLLTHFKYNINEAFEGFEDGQSKLSYSNPLILEPLMALESHKIHPNPEIYVDFKIQSPEELNESFDKIVFKESIDSATLSLEKEGKTVLEIHSDPELLRFIQYILENAMGTPLHIILKNLHLPKIEDFKLVLKNFLQMKEWLSTNIESIESKVAQLFSQNLSQ